MRRILAGGLVVLVTTALWFGATRLGRDDTTVRSTSQFGQADPDATTAPIVPTTEAVTGVLARDQSGCSGIGAPGATSSLTWIEWERPASGTSGSTLRTEGGGCLLRLAEDPFVRALAWDASGTQVFLRRDLQWTRVDADGTQTPVADVDVPLRSDAYRTSAVETRVEVPGGAVLVIEERGDDELIVVQHRDGRREVLAEGGRYWGTRVTGSPYDPSALAWSYVPPTPKADAGGCGHGQESRVTKARRGGVELALSGTAVEGLWPKLWLPDGALVLTGIAPGCDAPPVPLWLFRDGQATPLAESVFASGVRPAATP